jgi:hypothetical protein
MSDRRSGLQAARAVLDELNEGGPRVATFARGLALGALVGAALAGTALLERRSRTRAVEEPQPNPGDAPEREVATERG